jgi:hypothetical protein
MNIKIYHQLEWPFTIHPNGDVIQHIEWWEESDPADGPPRLIENRCGNIGIQGYEAILRKVDPSARHGWPFELLEPFVKQYKRTPEWAPSLAAKITFAP